MSSSVEVMRKCGESAVSGGLGNSIYLPVKNIRRCRCETLISVTVYIPPFCVSNCFCVIVCHPTNISGQSVLEAIPTHEIEFFLVASVRLVVRHSMGNNIDAKRERCYCRSIFLTVGLVDEHSYQINRNFLTHFINQ